MKSFCSRLIVVAILLVFFSFVGCQSVPETIASSEGGAITLDSSYQNVSEIFGQPVNSNEFRGVKVCRFFPKIPPGTKLDDSVTMFYVSHAYYLEDKLILLEIKNKDVAGPKGLVCGDDIAKAFKLFASTKQYKALGLTKRASDEEITNALTAAYDQNYTTEHSRFEVNGNYRLLVNFDYSEKIVQSFQVVRGTAPESEEELELTDEDFDASPSDIVEKYGYPTTISVFDQDALCFTFDRDNGIQVNFLNESFESSNAFMVNDTCKSPFGVQKGQSQAEVVKLLQVPGAKAYEFQPFYDNDSNLVGYQIQRALVPTDSVQKLQTSFKVPPFDPEAILDKDDLYLSNMSLSSSRQQVFEVLGTPKRIVTGYEGPTRVYQQCNFETGTVLFTNVESSDNLKTGRAMSYFTSDASLIGPRGLKVGDPIEKVLDVFPGNNDIDFANIEEIAFIYEKSPGDERNHAYVTVDPESKTPKSGRVFMNTEWVLGFTINYSNGIITELILTYMID